MHRPRSSPTPTLQVPEDIVPVILDAVQEGLRDLDAGRVVSDRDLARRLDARFGSPNKSAKKK